MTTQKFTEAELKSLKDIQQKYEDITYQLGQLTIQQIQVENKMGDYKVALQNLIEKEQQQAKILSEKYGVGTLDIDSGTFTPQK